MINVKLGGQLRTKIGQETVSVACDNGSQSTLGAVLDQIAEMHPDARELLMTTEGAITGGLLILLDESAARADREIVVADDSTVTLVPAISGG